MVVFGSSSLGSYVTARRGKAMQEEPKATSLSTSQSLAKSMCAQSSEVQKREIRFTNNDVPQYLENLRRFEEESKKAEYVVK